MPSKRNSQSHREQSKARRWSSPASFGAAKESRTDLPRSTWIFVLVVTAVWLTEACVLTTRFHRVMYYHAVATVPPALEFVAVYNGPLTLLLFLAATWLCLVYRLSKTCPERIIASSSWLALACLPFLLSMIRIAFGEAVVPLTILEPLWISVFTGVAVHSLLTGRQTDDFLEPVAAVLGSRVNFLILFAASSLAATWWYFQTRAYYDNFMLGFNDFGHFTQRVANTAAGRGFLLESPILPPFWDHFNPGLLLLVPLWFFTESIDLIFALQAICLASGGVLLWQIASALGAGRTASVMWGLAWLAHPALGQMNLAYTYGWHPVSLAIPLLLASLLSLIRCRYASCVVLAILAGSMEENIIVVIGLFAAARSVRYFAAPRLELSRPSAIDGGVNGAAWLIVAVFSCIVFMLVYRFSGLAEFQAGRFVALGNSPSEIVLSPILQPGEFWGKVFRSRTFVFLVALLSPFYVPAILRGYWALLTVLLPLGVLIVWDHAPAQSLAFQYPSGLLPFLWLAAIIGSLSTRIGNETRVAKAGTDTLALLAQRRALASSSASLATGLVLSLYIGQFPWSSPTLGDVEARTYATDPEMTRRSGSPDGIWLTETVESVRRTGLPVLATGRIAAHLVGCEEVETVGQYLQRRDKLAEITVDGHSPLRRYETLILDLLESYQQTPDESQQVLSEATGNGFEIETSNFQIVVLRRRGAP